MLIRTSLTLPEEDVRLLDRLAALDDKNRSEMMRYLLAELRPRLTQLVDVLEAAKANREALLNEIGAASIADLERLMPEVEKIDRQVLGALSRLEGSLAAENARTQAEQDEINLQAFGNAIGKPLPPNPEDPRPGNHGGHKSNGNRREDPK